VVPDPDDVQLGNDAVRLEGTVLYADLADSTELVKKFQWWFAAAVYKSYLVCVCRIIRENGGEITAFDGDRVMAVFIDKGRDAAAARAALQINYAVANIINPRIKEAFPKATYKMQQAVGVDRSVLYAARTGIRGSNDLVWVGTSANLAAKMCSLRQQYPTYISASVYNNLDNSTLYAGNPRQNMWNSYRWTEQGVTVYRSTFVWPP
jgi:class 3 adenylate cyclase